MTAHRPVPYTTLVAIGFLLIFALATFATWWLIHPQTIHGANFVVNSTADTVDANPGSGTCADSNGRCRLRAAKMETNSLPAGTYTILDATATLTPTVPAVGILAIFATMTTASDGIICSAFETINTGT